MYSDNSPFEDVMERNNIENSSKEHRQIDGARNLGEISSEASRVSLDKWKGPQALNQADRIKMSE